jgi:hypothetical protein
MRALVQDRDVLAVMPTGYGKSAIYQVAALHLHRTDGAAADSARRGPAVVVSPLIALQEDQLDGLLEDLGGASAVAINSGRKDSEVEDAWEAAERGEAAFLFLAPEQLAKAETVERLAVTGRPAVRGGRGPLRLLLGARLPPRLPAPGRGPRAARQPARRRADRNGLSPGARRDPAAPSHEGPAGAGPRLRPAQHPAGGRPAPRGQGQAARRRAAGGRAQGVLDCSTLPPARTPKPTPPNLPGTGCAPRPTTPAGSRASGMRSTSSSSMTGWTLWWRPPPLAWASTSPTSAS